MGTSATGLADAERRTLTVRRHNYRGYGLLIQSDVELPFHAATGSGRPDLRVRYGQVPDALPVARTRLGLWDAAPGNVLLRVPGIGRFQVTDGREITVDAENGVKDGAMVSYLTGTVLGACLQQRGIVTLHASAVATPAGAVLFAGRSGIGKSTLLASLTERGYAMLADDVTGIVLGADGCPEALSGPHTVWLWAHTMDEMGWERTDALQQVREGSDKYGVPIGSCCNAGVPVRGVFELHSHNRESIEIESVAPAAAFAPLVANTYRGRILVALGGQREHFRVIAAMANHAWLARVTRPLTPFLLDGLADRIEEYLDAAPVAVSRGGSDSGCRAN